MQSIRLLRCLVPTAGVLLACSCAAQVMQNRGVMPDGRQFPFSGQAQRLPAASPQTPQPTPNAATAGGTVPGAAGPGHSPAGMPNAPSSDGTTGAAPPALPPSLLDKPAQPAKITLSGGLLTVDADNSSLSQILEAVKTTSGMTVDGLGKDQRLFGRYGPGNPRDVLSALLDGAGYNFMMIGATGSGAPSTIILTERSTQPVGTTQAVSQPEPEEDDQPVINNPPQEPPIPRPSSVLTPPDASGHVRSPQEILQELERMRAQQQPPQ